MNDAVNGDAAIYRPNNNKKTTSKFFKYKTKIMGSTTADDNMLYAKVVVPLK